MKKKQKVIGSIIILGIFIIILSVKFISAKISESSISNLKEDDIFVEKLEEGEKENGKETKSNNDNKGKSSRITVEVKGEVKKPGVYILTKDSILKDLIYESGGITENGCIENINQAEKLRDNNAYKIPSKDEDKNNKSNVQSSATSQASGGTKEDSKQISLNNSTKEELSTLPGVGPATADKIIAWRETNGGFNTVEDLKKVSGIGETKFNNLKDKVVP